MYIGPTRKTIIAPKERHLIQRFITSTLRSAGAPFLRAPQAINMMLLWSPVR